MARNVYFVDVGPRETSQIRRVPKPGGPPETLDSGPSTGTLRHLPVGEKEVWFVDRDGLRAVPIEG